MKYLEYTPLDRISDFLCHLNLGERTIKGCLEAYSCKHAGADKKLSISLENEILDYLGKSTEILNLHQLNICHVDPAGRCWFISFLHFTKCIRTMTSVQTHQFFTKETWDNFKQIFNVYMVDASKEWAEENEGSSLLDILYKALDEVVKLDECEIYSYNPDCDEDSLLERGAMWAFKFFFYNRKLKRVVCFRFSCISNLVSDDYPLDGIYYEEDGEIFDDMDM